MGSRLELVLAAGAGDLRAAGEAAQDAETFALVDEALAVWRASGGAFDPTIAPLMAQHGFAGSAAGAGCLVDAAAIALDPSAWTIRFARPGVTLDFGGIAKGHALDQAGRGRRCSFAQDRCRKTRRVIHELVRW